MGKFNTHGGYFAPTGYFRVDTGGSHEENPNGGVQIGVDPEGTPNMLEEGEPVYNDYVYSDNITADKEILKKHNIPASYAGKLYSVIADSLVDEAEERPLDNISNNGLNAMLVRLADAQEEQKQVQEQQELENELASMSPEELEELEQMLAQKEALEAQQAQLSPEEQMAMEQQMQAASQEQVPMMQMPMMANGGFIRKFGNGTPGDVVISDAERAAAVVREAMAQKLAEREAIKRMRAEADSVSTARRLKRRMDREEKEAGIQARRTEAKEKGVVDINTNYLDSYAKGLILQYKEQKKAEGRFNAAKKAYLDFTGLSGISEPQVHQPDSVTAPTKALNQIKFNLGDVYACGGKINRYPDGGWVNFLNALNEYKVSRNPGGVRGTYRIDTRFPLGSGVDSIKALEDSDYYKNFTDYVLTNPTDPNVQSYLKALDEGTAPSVAKLFNGDKLSDNWQDLYRRRRYDQKGGIYHFNPTSLEELNSIIAANNNAPAAADVPVVPKATIADTLLTGYTGREVNDPYVEEPEVEAAINAYKKNNPGPWTKGDYTSGDTEFVGYPTIGRYAGAAFNALAGLHNIFQEPDVYDFGHVTPTFINGRLALQRQGYNPIDMQQAINQWQATQNAGYRAIDNAGLGPSTQATMLAAMYNGNRGYGNALTAAREYNDRLLSNVINQNNAAAQAEANFYNSINATNAHIANQNAWQNYRMGIQQDLYNKQAENEKYAAIARALDAASIDLSNIGRENFAMNQINTNRANLGYMTGKEGLLRYLAEYFKDKNV